MTCRSLSEKLDCRVKVVLQVNAYLEGSRRQERRSKDRNKLDETECIQKRKRDATHNGSIRRVF